MNAEKKKPFRTVPNGSRSGRRPNLSDAELDSCVAELAAVQRRLPTIDEIIAASGGCQRARAVAARKRQAQLIAENVISDRLVIPEHLHQRHLLLMREWLRLAHDNVAPWVQEVVDAGLESQQKLEARVAEQERLIAALEEQIGTIERELDVARTKVSDLQNRLREAELSACRWQAVAETKELARTP